MRYIVKRYIIELFEVEADNRKQAMDEAARVGDPYAVYIQKETAKKAEYGPKKRFKNE